MRRWSAWTFASTRGQGTACHDVIAGIRGDAIDPYLAAFAALFLVTSIPQQTVPTSAASLSPGFPGGVRFLGNPTPTCPAPDGLLPSGEIDRSWLLRSQGPFGGR